MRGWPVQGEMLGSLYPGSCPRLPDRYFIQPACRAVTRLRRSCMLAPLQMQ